MRLYLIIFFFFIFFSGVAQDTFSKKVAIPLQEHNIYFEKIFVHTNKATYSLDDTIWFKVYVGNKNGNPSLATTRLHVNLLNAQGEMIFSKNVFIHEGTGKGQFKLNSSIRPGKYYIQAYTNYMLNFGENNYFLQEINIIGNKNFRNNSKENYGFEIFPEGGSLLEGTQNVVGIRYLIDGEGVYFSGKIVNSRNKEIASFKNQYMGMAKSSFFYEPGEEYKALIDINDTIIKVEIPVAKSRGMILSVDNSREDTLRLLLRTNKNTFDNLKNANYTLLYHQRNKIIGFLQISKLDSLNALINSDKNVFYEGVNTITLFKDHQPIGERKFFIEKDNQEIEASLSAVSVRDSIIYKLRLQKNGKPIKGHFSVSVMAPGANNFQRIQNIKSAFLLAPYINGYIENPAYYFDKENTKRKKHLDLLLLTQGWAQHSLKEMIKDLNPRPQFDFELGFILKGELVPPFASNQLVLISNKNRIVQKLYINGNKEFAFEKLLLYKGDTVKVAFLDNDGKAIKPEGLHFDPAVTKSYPAIETPYKDVVENEKNISGETGEDWLSPNAIKLDEVLLSGKKRSERYRRRRALIEKYKPLVWDIGKYYEISLPSRYKGFNNDLISFLSFNHNVTLVNWKGTEYYLKVPIKKEALIYINGELIKNIALLGLSSINMNDVENIMVQPVKGNRIYQVFTTENHQNNIEELAVEYVMEYGYDRPKKYYPPNNDFNRARNNTLTEVDWKAEVRTNEKGEALIKIDKKNASKKIYFLVQGISEEGKLISLMFKK